MARKRNSSHDKTRKKISAAVEIGKTSKTKKITKTRLEKEPAPPIFPVDISKAGRGVKISNSSVLYGYSIS
jgi:hypothetical protein